jgi:hypothetical protein
MEGDPARAREILLPYSAGGALASDTRGPNGALTARAPAALQVLPAFKLLTYAIRGSSVISRSRESYKFFFYLIDFPNLTRIETSDSVVRKDVCNFSD